MFHLRGVQKSSETGEGVHPDRQNTRKSHQMRSFQTLCVTFRLNKASSPPLVSMVTVDKIQETATVLERETGQRERETGVQTDRSVTHHLKVSVFDVTKGFADVTAGEPLIGSGLSVLPGSQTAQSL